MEHYVLLGPLDPNPVCNLAYYSRICYKISLSK